ncbi:immunity 53 family protein [Aerococcaceae bacterium NML180378]|nr:immunity 53 family protein [Aerococcaceae bacterium NML180378]
MNLHTQHISKVKIETFDNPGWGIEVYLPMTVKGDRRTIMNESPSEEDWIFLFEEDGRIRAGGDEQKLVRMVQLLADYFGISDDHALWVDVLPFITYLQNWYTFECDGFWEHLYGVSGEINAEGHCLMTIDLDETYWDEEPFETVGDVATFQCRKEGAKFIGEGKLEHVGIFLQTFKDWIESFDIVVLQTHEYKYYVPANELYGE